MNDQYMITLSDENLSELIGLSVYQIKKYNKELIKKGLLKISKDKDGNEVKIFKLNNEQPN